MTWGKKLKLGMSVFIIFIVILSFIMISRSGDDALVEKDYYEKGQLYEGEFNAQQKAYTDKMLPTLTIGDAGLNIVFPANVNYNLIFRRPSDSSLDTSATGSAVAGVALRIEKHVLQSGPWKLRIEYKTGTDNYVFEKEITMP